jgi:SAM-dependent methyltransferase
VEEASRESAERVRSLLQNERVTPRSFRAELERVPPGERDAWLDQALGLDSIPEDGPALPPCCVPYLPCSVAALLYVLDEAQVGASDVFVDVGSGVGRAAALVHLSTGAAVVGLEIQPELVRVARELAARLSLHRFTCVEGDAAELAPLVTIGTIFFLYCPFSGARLQKLLDDLERVARMRRIRVCTVDMPLPQRSWLRLVSSLCDGSSVYESTFVSHRSAAS